ncbi:MAG: endonuclease/exonuclease/phosphatase family protein [Tepidiformaceae bacterium]
MSICTARSTLLAAVLVALLVAACGGDDAGPVADAPSPVTTAAASPAATPTGDPPEPPTEFRVAFINLLSPISLDANDVVAAETFEERLTIVIEELKAFSPDLVAFNEVSFTTRLGSARERLLAGLKMEYAYTRANPWFQGQTQAASDLTAKQVGFDEGELVLSRYPILRAERHGLNPRTSETEGRAALHVVIKAPAPMDELDVYVTHLTGGGEKIRHAQAIDFLSFVANTAGKGPVLLLGDLSEASGSATHKVFIDRGLFEVVPMLGKDAVPTCCRESVVGQQPPPGLRTDFIFASGWEALSATIFASTPAKRADGTLLYASDHNGMLAVFPFPSVQP